MYVRSFKIFKKSVADLRQHRGRILIIDNRSIY